MLELYKKLMPIGCLRCQRDYCPHTCPMYDEYKKFEKTKNELIAKKKNSVKV